MKWFLLFLLILQALFDAMVFEQIIHGEAAWRLCVRDRLCVYEPRN